MSYDIYIGEDDYSYTFNLSQFFHDTVKVIGKDSTATGLQALYGMCAEDAEVVLERALDEAELIFLTDDPVKLEELRSHYNPSNGWGSVEVAIILLHKMIRSCRKWPFAFVKVHQ